MKQTQFVKADSETSTPQEVAILRPTAPSSPSMPVYAGIFLVGRVSGQLSTPVAPRALCGAFSYVT